MNLLSQIGSTAQRQNYCSRPPPVLTMYHWPVHVVIHATFASAKRKPGNIKACTGLEPLTSAISKIKIERE